MKTFKPILTSIGLAIFLAGCGSPKDANKDNFKKAINNYLEKNCVMVSTRDDKFPVTVELLPSDNKWAAKKNPGKTLQYDALVSIGMLEVQNGSAEVNKGIFGNEKITVPTKIYSLSSKGKKSISKIASRGLFGGSKQGFCSAIYKVDDISNFSEPSETMGYTISRVNYSFSPTDIADWSSNQAILKAFTWLSKGLERKQEESAVLVLMSDGWIHEKDMKK